MLYQLGVLQFATQPVTIKEYERDAEADFAWKDVVGALRPAEPTGEGSDEMTIRGVLHPHRFDGLGELAVLDEMRRSQEPQILVRGDGTSLGWRVLTRLREHGTFLDVEGIGRCIEVDVSLKKVPSPSRASMISFLTTLVGQILR